MLEDMAILENDGNKWGVLSFKKMLLVCFHLNIDYIGLSNKVEEGLLKTNYYIVKKDNKWFIVDDTNTQISDSFNEPIIDYSVTSNTLVLAFKSSINIYNLSTKKIIEQVSFNGSFNSLDSIENNNRLDVKLDGNTIKSVEITN